VSVTFQDLQHRENPLNGSVLRSTAAVRDLLLSLRGREPFFFELEHSEGYRLTIGYGADIGTVQHAANDSQPPYLVAVNHEVVDDDHVSYLAGNTPTPVPRRYCLPTEVVQKVVTYFVENHGDRLPTVDWEELLPGVP
jgi:hypothetical protein